MSARNSNRQNGFTLVECAASIVILGVALVAAMGLFTIHEQAYAMEQAAAKALVFLERELESVRDTEFEALQTSAYAPVPEDNTYQVRRVVTSVDSVTREVDVEVRWTTPIGNSRSERLSTVRCKGLQ